jgi:antitoxin MazE
MNARIQLWGNSLALRIPRAFAKETNLSNGSEVELRLEEGKLVVIPQEPTFTLSELLARVTPKNRHQETDFGEPEGQEIW